MAKLSETQLFGFLCHGDLSNVIRSVSDEQLRLILPLLVRVGLCPSPHLFSRTATSSTDVRAFLLGCSRVNWILRLLKVDFSILQATLKKDVQIRYISCSCGSLLHHLITCMFQEKKSD